MKAKNILDVGCGTGRHLDFFRKDGFKIAGVDASENMIVEAKKNLSGEKNLICSRASEFKFDEQFDIIISLFHVMNYQTETRELEKVFHNISDHLDKDGLFIFDFWYGPAVLSDPPVVKIKRMEDERDLVTRITEPVMHYNENIVDVNFEVIVEDKKSHCIERINETHRMRYLFLPEIEYLAAMAGLKTAGSFGWMTFGDLSCNTWYGIIILKKQ